MREEDLRDSDQDRPRWTRLHLWQIQLVRDLFVAGGLVLVLLLGERISIVTVPIVAAMLLAYLVDPLVGRITRSGRVGRRVTALGMLLAGCLFVLLPMLVAVGFALVQGVQLAEFLAGRAGAVIASVEQPTDAELRDALGSGSWRDIRDFLVEVRDPAGDPSRPESAARKLAQELGVDQVLLARGVDSALLWLRENARGVAAALLERGAGLVGTALAALSTVGRALFMLFLTGFFFFFACWRWPAVKAGALSMLPQRNREHALDIALQMDRAIAGFVRGRLIVALILGIFYSTAFALIGVPAPLLLGPIIAFLAIFPYAPVLALPVAIVLLWLEPHAGVRGAWWWILFVPIAVYQVGQALDDYVLTPRIQGDATGLDTPTILTASIAGGTLLGLFGLLVAIPLAACLRILVREVFLPRYRAWTAGERGDFLPVEED